MNLHLTKGSRERSLAILTLVIMAIFIVRLFYLQVIRHNYYMAQANAEQVKQLTIPATRGLIYGMDGSSLAPLVLNQAVYTVYADPSEVTNSQKVIDMVTKVAGGNAVSNMSALLANKQSRYAVLAYNVSRTQAADMKNENLAGVGFTEGTERVYPEGDLAGQVLGFVNAAGQGQYGVEGYFNKQLSGTNGMLKTVTDVRDVPLDIGSNNVDKPAVNGQNIALTVDRNIQAEAQKVLADNAKKLKIKNESVIVMDPNNGHVLAMANYPSYNPGDYNTVTDPSVFQNAVISSPYEPGSDTKTLTSAAAINEGVMKPSDTYTNTGQIDVDGSIINNATKTANITGNITIQTAMDYSLNTGFVTVEQWLGGQNAPPGTATINTKARDELYKYFHDRFRLGEMTGIQLQGEDPGTIYSPNDAEGGAVRYSNMAFGQGFDATMLQMATAFSSVVNGGTYYYPTIYAGTVSSDGTTLTPAKDRAPVKDVVSSGTSQTVRAMVHDARDRFYAKDDTPGYYVGGKTGTSQVIVNGTYSLTKTIGTYLGFGGAVGQLPSYVIMVRVSNADYTLEGNFDAMPVFNQLSNWMLRYLKLQPKG
ncbi:MAG TPA: penicillin-binding protein 2 [Candidatus Saccharimonadaceae bacterium]|nr:penicillin-binding protein 2 [Candidatus Saccharimonadaceae bacterium]